MDNRGVRYLILLLIMFPFVFHALFHLLLLTPFLELFDSEVTARYGKNP